MFSVELIAMEDNEDLERALQDIAFTPQELAQRFDRQPTLSTLLLCTLCVMPTKSYNAGCCILRYAHNIACVSINIIDGARQRDHDILSQEIEMVVPAESEWYDIASDLD
jgi:hypothetical protein